MKSHLLNQCYTDIGNKKTQTEKRRDSFISCPPRPTAATSLSFSSTPAAGTAVGNPGVQTRVLQMCRESRPGGSVIGVDFPAPPLRCRAPTVLVYVLHAVLWTCVVLVLFLVALLLLNDCFMHRRPGRCMDVWCVLVQATCPFQPLSVCGQAAPGGHFSGSCVLVRVPQAKPVFFEELRHSTLSSVRR